MVSLLGAIALLLAAAGSARADTIRFSTQSGIHTIGHDRLTITGVTDRAVEIAPGATAFGVEVATFSFESFADTVGTSDTGLLGVIGWDLVQVGLSALGGSGTLSWRARTSVTSDDARSPLPGIIPATFDGCARSGLLGQVATPESGTSTLSFAPDPLKLFPTTVGNGL